MFERFTDRARKMVALANFEAIRRGYPAIDTEHVLLAMVIEESGVAANVLKSLLGDLATIRAEIEKSLNPATMPITDERLPQTRLFKNAITFAMEESRSLNHEYVGTEHILLGLLRETDGKASQILQKFGITAERLRESILALLGDGNAVLPPISSPTSPAHIPYRSAVEMVGGPSLPHIFAGIACGFLFLVIATATVLMVLIELKAAIAPRQIFPSIPPYPHPVLTLVTSSFGSLMCLFACWVMLRLTIRQFSPRKLRRSPFSAP
jgi:hypothetical protein